TGFEPATPSPPEKCATGLRYAPTGAGITPPFGERKPYSPWSSAPSSLRAAPSSASARRKDWTCDSLIRGAAGGGGTADGSLPRAKGAKPKGGAWRLIRGAWRARPGAG